MILLVGNTGYIGSAFETALKQRGETFATVSKSTLDCTDSNAISKYLKIHRPEFVINAAGFTGNPNVDACEANKAAVLKANLLLPQRIADACMRYGIPWGHVSSGCIYNGAIVQTNGKWKVETDLTNSSISDILNYQPARVRGFSETDQPNFTFRDPVRSFYSGSKAMAEELIAQTGMCYLWRLRMPFDSFNHPRNYLTKLQLYEKAYCNFNSISHRGDFANACLDSWKLRIPFGKYNVTNPGFLSTRQIIEAIQKALKPQKKFQYWSSDADFYKHAATSPRSNCILDTSKLASAGVQVRTVHMALEHSLNEWLD